MKKDKALLERIAAEIIVELSNVRKVKAEFLDFRKTYPAVDRFLVRALASYLEDFYNACEKVFKVVAEELNGGVPKGENWHKTLLSDMAVKIGKRPPVISPEMLEKLGQYLGFRHIVRHVYGFGLNAAKVELLAGGFPAAADDFCEEIDGFVKGFMIS